jgi:hypothetical protein
VPVDRRVLPATLGVDGSRLAFSPPLLHEAAPMKLPKDLSADLRHDAVLQLLTTHRAPLWESGAHLVATASLTKGLSNVLRGALHMGYAVQGLELVADTLLAEQKGLDAASSKTSPPSERVSRLLLVTSDGSTRFYRDADALLSRYGHRLMGLRLDLSGEELGQALFGSAKLVRSVLVTDKKVVTRALLSLVS